MSGIGIDPAGMRSFWSYSSSDEKMQMILDILRYVSPFVAERRDNYWRIISETLLKVEIYRDP